MWLACLHANRDFETAELIISLIECYCLNFPGTSTFMEALAANGTTNIQTSVTGVTASKRRFIDDRRDQPFDKRLRFSVRQTESAYRYRDIVVRKQDGFTHILLSTKSSENNSLNPEVRKILIWGWGEGEGVGVLREFQDSASFTPVIRAQTHMKQDSGGCWQGVTPRNDLKCNSVEFYLRFLNT